ncbi:hypothetical protein GC194_04890 [bacterium]|nr:hypothetical protein [bacterium]
MNKDANFYWPFVVTIISGLWAVITLIRDRISNSIEQTNATISRLLEFEKWLVENPVLQKYLSQNVGIDEAYFRDENRLEEDIFFKVKSLVYGQLNLFDEILSVSNQSQRNWFITKPASLIELTDWETYIKEKLRHPLYRSILNNESQIFGTSLRDFWIKNKEDIENHPADPFMW